jgi:hypothetical protein
MIVVEILAVAAALLVVQLVHVVVVIGWSDRRTRGTDYYGLPPRERQRFRRLLRIHALLLSPFLALLAAATRPKFSQRCFVYKGVAGPAGACSTESFRRAEAYRPGPEDVFVVTQLRSGTTWMQHLVFQVLLRGGGDLAGSGVALGAVSPWLESDRTVGVGDAPLLGDERPSRLIKTHLPASLCPFSPQAKYIYVARHPASCFASCVDYVRNNLHGFSPELAEFEHWFRSDELMWWNTWAVHVAGWWQRARRKANVLFVRFEDMKSDLVAVARRVAEFLDVRPLTESELAAVAGKCSFAYMRQHADAFEMHPPHLLQEAGAFFVSGRSDRHRDIPPEVGKRIADWCRRECAANSFPVHRLYPDLAPDKETPAGPIAQPALG